MREINRKSISEVLEILKNSEEAITSKIPEKFMQFLNDNADKEYKVEIDFNNEEWKETISQDAKAMLALIYRDYVVSKEEREKLLKEEQEIMEKEQEEARIKYNPDNLFKRNNKTTETQENNTEEKRIIEVKQETWYKKIWKKIIGLFGRK